MRADENPPTPREAIRKTLRLTNLKLDMFVAKFSTQGFYNTEKNMY